MIVALMTGEDTRGMTDWSFNVVWIRYVRVVENIWRSERSILDDLL